MSASCAVSRPAHGADQPNASIIFERKESQKIALVQPDMYLAVHQRACRLDIGDVENVLVSPTGKADIRSLEVSFAVAEPRGPLAATLAGVIPPDFCDSIDGPETRQVILLKLDPAREARARLARCCRLPSSF